MNSTKNTKTDRMGGFISAEIISVKDIDLFQVNYQNVTITKKTGVAPNMLDIVKNGVDAQVTSTTIKSGELFTIDISIELKEQKKLPYMAFNKYLAVLETPTGEKHIFGTLEFPLTLNCEPIYSKTPGGRTGSLLKMRGNQPNNVLIM